jgi:hypothetical protein
VGGIFIPRSLIFYLLDRKLFPRRLQLTIGDSTDTVPTFAELHPDLKCDLLLIDGGHWPEIVRAGSSVRVVCVSCACHVRGVAVSALGLITLLADLVNFRAMANMTRHLLIMDDTFFPDDNDVGVSPGVSLELSALHSSATDGPTVAWNEAVYNGSVLHNYSFVERYCDCFEFTRDVAPDGTLEWENCMERQFNYSGWDEWDSGVSVGAYR